MGYPLESTGCWGVPMKSFRMPTYSVAMEKELYAFNMLLLNTVINNFTNQVIKKLNKRTIQEFAFTDANYARVIKRLANVLAKKLEKRFDADRINKHINKVYGKAEKINKEIFYERYAEAVSIDSKAIINKDIDKEDIYAQIETVKTTLAADRDDYIAQATLRSLEVANRGGGYDELVESLKALKKTSKDRLAQKVVDQVANFTTTVNGLRATKLGLRYARWRTSKDNTVRKSHKARDGEFYVITKGLYSPVDKKTLRPGFDYRCRCWEEYIVDESMIPEDVLKRLAEEWSNG